GLIVSNGQSLGRFAFDGVVFGKVEIPGDIKSFYAGWILTGDAHGARQGVPIFLNNFELDPNSGRPREIDDGLFVPRDNFFVGGDLESLYTQGIGWDGSYSGSRPHYMSGTEVRVNGRLGNVTVLGPNAADFHVLNQRPITSQHQSI